MTKPRASKDKRYEDRHKEERKAKCMVWGTSVDRKEAEEINAFLKEYGYTKVQLIQAGYKALLDDAAEHDLELAKTMEGKKIIAIMPDVGDRYLSTGIFD